MTEQIAEPQTEIEFPEAQFRSDVTARLVDSMGGEHSIVRRARVSVIGADGEEVEIPEHIASGSDAGLIRWLYKNRHGTPFEGVEFEWYFHVPIFVSRQIVKHRLSSINEESGRYRELEGVFYVTPDHRLVAQDGKVGDYNFVEAPEGVREALQQVQMMTANAGWINYNKLLHIGVAKESARTVLPVTTYSSMYFKTNLRSMLNFVSLRKDWGEDAAHRSHAQAEIEWLTDQIAPIIQEKLPTVWQAFVDSGYEAV